MMGLFRSIAGMVEAELTAADPGRALMQISQAGIHVFDTRHIDDLTLRFRIRRADYKSLHQILAKRGDSLRITGRWGLYWTVKGLVNRPVLMTGLIMMLLVALYLPSRICFVRVEGNTSVPTRHILEAARECGICFGASRREVRSERMKNSLLSQIPELQWAGVNTKGCVAVISVREKTVGAEETEVPAVSSIVAVRDGIIVSCTAEQGDLKCRAGQAVREGEVLICGYTDCGLTVRVTRSIGEVFAETRQDLEVITPSEYTFRGPKTGVEKKYALIIGKKRINFYKDSGILGTTCDKMSTVNYITLPGGFTLPVALVTEQWTGYECRTESVSDEWAAKILCGFADGCLNSKMIAGRILQKDEQVTTLESCYQLTGRYECIEMIGREQSEETLEYYGKTD